MMDESSVEVSPSAIDSPPVSDGDGRVYLVPYRWWKEAQDPQPGSGLRGVPYAACQTPTSYGMKIINNLFGSDLVFNLRRDGDLREDEDDGSRGRCYALIGSDLWAQALNRHTDSDLTVKKNGSFLFTEDSTTDVYPLILRISVIRETNILVVKISKKDNAVENYKRASKIFGIDSEPVRIWDFSGRTNLILMEEWNRVPLDCNPKSDQEVLLEVQVSALLENMICKSEAKKDNLQLDQSKLTGSCYGDLMCNGSLGYSDSDLQNGSLKGGGLFGLRGLDNLGNTCFMNSSLQCLAHTPKLVEYFHGNYRKEINAQNPLGMKGELAMAFGDLLRNLCTVDRSPVVPHVFKGKLARFAPQFSGFNQHDSQELLAFLLDGLHEDLNRVKHKPYVEAKDASSRPDEEVADEYWGNHLARNDSIIVDICQGQYKSTLVCPVCSKVSITFDPFMYLSLPLPSTTMRTMAVTVFSTDGSIEPSTYTINVPKLGKLKDLIQALGVASSLRDDESLLIAEVYANCILRFLDEPSDSISLIRDEDRLAAYRLPKDVEKSPLVVFVHQRLEEHYILSKRTNWKGFGVPLVTTLPDVVDGSTIRKLFLKLLSPFRKSKDSGLDDEEDKCTSISSETNLNMEAESECMPQEVADVSDTVGEFQFHLTDEKSKIMQSKIEMDEPTPLPTRSKHLYVIVCWQSKVLEQHDTNLLNTLPEIYKVRPFPKKSQDSCTLYACLEAFLKDEPLGPEDMWYCPSCKKHQQATKKLDLWRLPEVLVIHLKRFSYTRYTKNKLETLVEFPIRDLDLTNYIAGTPKQISNNYQLYAVSNHYGNMGGGHYTAFVYHGGENRWYDFDDRNVIPIAEESIKTSAAYVLFYRRT